MATSKELKLKARGLKVKGYGSMTKDQLIEAIATAEAQQQATEVEDHLKSKMVPDHSEEAEKACSAPLFGVEDGDVVIKTKEDLPPGFLENQKKGFFRRHWGATLTIGLITFGIALLAYVNRPEPAWYEKLMDLF